LKLALIALLCLANLASAQPAASSPDSAQRPWIRSVAFSADGKLLAAGAGEPMKPGTATVWELSTGKLRFVIRADEGLPGVAFSPDGQTLAIGGYDHQVRLVDVASGQVRDTLAGHSNPVRSVSFSPDGQTLASAGFDKAIKLWNMPSGTLRSTLTGPKDRVFFAVFSPDGKRLAGGGWEPVVTFWDLESGQSDTLQFNSLVVRALVYSPDSRWLVTSGFDGKLRVCEAGSRTVAARIPGGGDAVALSTPARVLATCTTQQKSIALYELDLNSPDAQRLARIEELLVRLDDESYDVREAATRDFVALGFAANTALRQARDSSSSPEVRIRARRILDEMFARPQARLDGHSEPVECLTVSPDGQTLASGSRDGAVKLWDLATRRETATLAP
jgi:WD40 repeat protein